MRKLSRLGTKREFRGENVRGLLRSNYYLGVAFADAQRTRVHATWAIRISQNFAEKTFVDGSETTKKGQSFPLYGSTYVHTRTQVVLYDIHVLRVQFCLVSISSRCIIILVNAEHYGRAGANPRVWE